MGKLITVIALIATLGLAACNVEKNDQKPSGDAENISGEIFSNDSGEIVGDVLALKNDFELLKYMTDTENYMVSPFSLRMAMMLAANGASGLTKNEILTVFRYR